MRAVVHVAAAFVLVGLSVLAGSCVPDPEDALDFGTLCIPESDTCPATTQLERDVVGRNQIDYVVTNTGTNVAVVEVVALVPSAALAIDPADGEIAPDDLVARRQHTPVEPGVGVENRFTAQDLGVREAIQFGMRCTGCTAELDWVFASVPRECFENDACPAGWQCDDNIGRCAECLSNSDCNEDQRCDLSRGRCDPPATTAGCTTGAGGLSPIALLLFVLFLGALRRKGRRVIAPAVAVVGLCVVAPSAAGASPPRASIAVGAGARVLAGELGPLTRRGVGLSLGQELRWRYFGAGLSLGTSYYLTEQEPPPFSRSLQTYGATLGPRFYLPLSLVELVAGADYRRLGTANNSLVRITGTRTSFDAAGGFSGVRLRWSGLEVRLEGSAHHVFQMRSTMFSADLSVGFTNVR